MSTAVYKIVDGEKIELTAEEYEELEQMRAAQAELGSSEDLMNPWDAKRRQAYPSIGDQLDDLFKSGAFSEEMAAKIQAVKDSIPKPE